MEFFAQISLTSQTRRAGKLRIKPLPQEKIMRNRIKIHCAFLALMLSAVNSLSVSGQPSTAAV